MNPYNPYAPPPGPPQYGAQYGMAQWGMPYREMDALVMPKVTRIPEVCVKCSHPQVAAHPRKTFTFTPQWVTMTVLISPLIAMILSAVMRKSATFEVPLCATCDAEWKKGNRNLALSFVPGVIMMVLGILLLASDISDMGGLIILASVMVFIFAPIVMQLSYRKKRTIWARKIDDRSAWLVGVHPAAIDAACNLGQTIPMPTQQQMTQPYPPGFVPPHLTR